MVYCEHYSQNIHSHFNVSVKHKRIFGRRASAVVCTNMSPRTLPVQTAKDDTAYTQVSDKPDEPSETPANQPMRNGSYIAMSPVEAQKC